MDVLQDEVDSLQAILMDDVKITKNAEDIPVMISTTIFPTVGDETDKQYVCVTLEVIPTKDYPEASPNFRLVKPRGLDDTRLNEIKTACDAKLSECLGCPVVFDLIEIIREHLTGSNLPSGQCVVCLYGFQDGDEFIKTECYHYLHSYCLARHLIAARRNYRDEQEKLPAWLQMTAKPFEASCPVCRERIPDDESSLKTAMPPAELENAPDFCLTDDLKELQKKMMNLFLRQKSRGAIIDIDNKPVISIQPQEEARLERLRNSDINLSSTRSTDDSQNVGGRNRDFGSNAQSNNARSNQNPNGSTNNANNSNHKSLPQSKHSTNTSQPNVTYAKESTNNNFHHHQNRRHSRGGRRHQNHHYHQYHSGRHEPNTGSTDTTDGGATGGAQEQTQPKQNQKSSSHGNSGKSHKHQTAAGSSNFR